MLVDAEDLAALTEFPLLGRWTEECHAKLDPDELASIRPIRPDRTSAIWHRGARVPVVPSNPEARVDVDEGTDPRVISKWLEDRLPRNESDLLLFWDQKTAALVPRRLFIDRWDDFWYPSSDDLTVVGTVAVWRLEMSHHGAFEFFQRGAG
jgi:hypothetical protein